MHNGKTPVPDGVAYEALVEFTGHSSASVLSIINEHLNAVNFPVAWKKGKLVLLHKGKDKHVSDSSSF